jgi:hypothetical protein
LGDQEVAAGVADLKYRSAINSMRAAYRQPPD